MRSLPSRHLVVVSVGLLAGGAGYTFLPTDMPPSWSSQWGVFWLGRPMLAFLLPVAGAITFLMLRSLYSRQITESSAAARPLATYDALMFRVLLFLTAVHTAVIVALTGTLFGHSWVNRIVPALVGMTLVGVGNLLPRTEPNLAIGVRTLATLTDRVVWKRTHRLAGYLMVVLGAVILVAATVFPAPVGSRAVLAVGPVALLSIPALVMYARRARARTSHA